MEKEARALTHSLIHVESSDASALNISELLTNKFDYVVKRDMYKPHKETLAVYDFLRQIMINKNNNIKTPIVILSSDTAISGGTIAGVTEKFMYAQDNVYKSNLKVIYIDSSPDMATKKYSMYGDFVNSILSDTMGITDSSFTLHRVPLSPENIYLVGIDENILSDEQDGLIRKHNINSFSLQNMKKKGIDKIMKHIIETCQYDDVHIVIDLACMDIKYAPSVYREVNVSDGFDYDQMIQIVDSLKKLQKINSIDITGYNFGNITDKELHHTSNMLTIRTIVGILSSLIDLKQQTINVFNEDSRFLIWKKLDDDNPIGWLILRNMDLKIKEELIKNIGDDRIITISINDEDDCYEAFVTTTCMREQQEKSFYTATSVYDCCLYPGEKLNMCFELINNPMVPLMSDAHSFPEDHHTVNGAIKMNVLT